MFGMMAKSLSGDHWEFTRTERLPVKLESAAGADHGKVWLAATWTLLSVTRIKAVRWVRKTKTLVSRTKTKTLPNFRMQRDLLEPLGAFHAISSLASRFSHFSHKEYGEDWSLERRIRWLNSLIEPIRVPFGSACQWPSASWSACQKVFVKNRLRITVPVERPIWVISRNDWKHRSETLASETLKTNCLEEGGEFKEI